VTPPGGQRRVRVLITVKTYPTPSSTYSELVCTAGVIPGEGFIRIFPVQFRQLPYEQQYRKYHWIDVTIGPPGGRDKRPDSYRPVQDSIQILDRVDTADGWAERKRLILPFVSSSLDELRRRRKEEDGPSLGIFRPAEVLDFDWTACKARSWSDDELERLQRRSLFAQDLTPLEKIPYHFRYRFRCDDSRCPGQHRIKIIDWELGRLFLRMRQRYDEEVALDKVRDKFFGQLCGDRVDTHFYMGTTTLPYESWLVLGVFYPPTAPQDRLFD